MTPVRGRPPASLVPAVIAGRAAKEPDHPAVTHLGTTHTYRQLDHRANAIAHHLAKAGAGPGDVVGLRLPRGTDLVAAVLAVWKRGAAYVPLDPTYPAARIDFMVDDSGAALVVDGGDLVAIGQATAAEPPPGPALRSNDLAYVIYTSGSTGVPKGVMVEHGNLGTTWEAWDERYGFSATRPAVLSTASPSFDVFTGDLVHTLCSGGRLVLGSDDAVVDPAALVDLLHREGIASVDFVPGVLRNVLHHLDRTGGRLDSLCLVTVGSEAWFRTEWETLRAVCGPGTRVVNAYGVTEATIDSLHFEGALPVGTTPHVPIGRPLANTRATIVDGELLLGGPGIARGYCNRPDLTTERFVPDPDGPPGSRLYRTGDLARVLPDGNLEFVGRADDQVKVRGFRVEPGEVEAVLAAQPGVADAAITAHDGALVAYFVPADGPVEADAVRSALARSLPQHLVPSAVVAVDALPRLPNGKLDRSALHHQAPPRPRGKAVPTTTPPRTHTEKAVARIWADVLGLPAGIGVDDDFFALGGHSLLAARIAARVEDELKVTVPPVLVLDHPTVAAFTAAMAAGTAGPQKQLPPLTRVKRDAPIPASFAQQRLWFFEQFRPEHAAYHLPLGLRLTGSLDVDRLVASLQQLVDRHEALRTCFLATEGAPMQMVDACAQLLVPVGDLTHLGPEQAAVELTRLAEADARRPFDLGQAPLVRARVVALAEADHAIVICLHHVVADGVSIEILERELGALYAGQRLAPLPIQYADYAAWQRRTVEAGALQEDLAWWREHLAGTPALLELPADHPRPTVQSFRGGVATFAVPRATRQAVESLSAAHRATPFAALLAAYTAVLRRWTGADDIVLGTPVAARNRSEFEGVIGFFVNTVPVRIDASGDPSFADLLDRTRHALVASLAHQDVPFDVLVEALAPPRALSHNPVVQTAFVLQSAPLGITEIPGVHVDPFPVEAGGSAFDLTIEVEDAPDGGLAGRAVYSADLFERATIERLTGHLCSLLHSAAADPARPLSQLDLMNPIERQQLVVDWNRTDAPFPAGTLVPDLVAEHAGSRPGAPAVRDAHGALSYAELESRANRLARHLRGLGVSRGHPVGVCLNRSRGLVVACLAVLKAGGAYLPLDPDYPPARLRLMLADTGSRVVVTSTELAHALEDEAITLLTVDADSDAAAIDTHPDTRLPLDGEATDLAYVVYTSGSTGVPKGAGITHQAITRLLVNTDYISLGPGSAVAQASSPSFDAFTFEIWGPLLNGGRVEILPRDAVLSAPLLRAAIAERGIDSMFLTTALFNQLVREDASVFAGVANVLFGGEEADARRARQVLESRPPERLVHVYGPSETTTFAAWYLVTEVEEGAATLPIGRPIANTRIYLLDDRLKPVPGGVPGEIFVGGPGVATGYLNRPELTADRFLPSPFLEGDRLYRTGDLARFRTDGNIEFLGRIDEQVKVRGFRIELGEVEAALGQHPAVKDAVAVVRHDAGDKRGGDKRVVAYAVPEPGAHLTAGEVRSFLRRTLPEYMLPAAFVELDAIPLTANGKVDRAALPPPAVHRPELEQAFLPPRTDDERQLAAIWCEVLDIDEVGRHDNFFDLGGHSLLATRVTSRVRLRLGVELPLRLVFEAPTLEELAAAVGRLRQETAGPSTVPPLVRLPRPGEPGPNGEA